MLSRSVGIFNAPQEGGRETPPGKGILGRQRYTAKRMDPYAHKHVNHRGDSRAEIPSSTRRIRRRLPSGKIKALAFENSHDSSLLSSAHTGATSVAEKIVSLFFTFEGHSIASQSIHLNTQCGIIRISENLSNLNRV